MYSACGSVSNKSYAQFLKGLWMTMRAETFLEKRDGKTKRTRAAMSIAYLVSFPNVEEWDYNCA